MAAAGARVCLVGFGSAGDLHPLLAIAGHLLSRGRQVTLLANPVFGERVQAAGIGFVPVGSTEDHEAAFAHPKFWHPVDGFGVMWRYLLRPAMEATYERLAGLASQGPCVVLAQPVAFGARIAQEKLGLPLVTLYTAATMLRTVHHPMTMAQWRLPRWVPASLRLRAWDWLDRHKLEPLVRADLAAVRGRLGLAPLTQPVFGRWMHSPQAGVTLFPPWFAPAAPDWPAQLVHGGFPLYDADAQAPVDESLAEFLREGPKPVVFMPGTWQRGAADFHAAALAACRRLRLRGLLLGIPSSGLPAALPPTVRAADYVPFGWLLPRARALVHHGGIGSCAQALRAGIPQLVVPQAYDQFDNAMRLEQLGVGAGLRGGPRRFDRVGHRLARLLDDPRVASACARWAPQVSPHAAHAAVDVALERLA
jgi:rhamnosyltransferase subunit B